MGVSQTEFRQALGHFATGVTVITVARGAGQVHGMTANAFTSVSLDPPLVLVCVARSSRTHPLLLAQRRFGITVLREEQQAVARYFADVSQDHEAPAHLGIRYRQTERGTVLLEPCLAQLECLLRTSQDAGDHTLFLAEVESVAVHEARPLLFYRGQYRQLGAEAT